MFIRDGICYAGNEKPMLKVIGIKPMDNHILWLRFNTGEVKTFDFTPYLNQPAFAPLLNVSLFKEVYIDYGVPVWDDGNIDIAPETLYEQGQLI